MKENTEELNYGYSSVAYVGFGLIGSGIVGIALAIIFTSLAYSTWVLVLSWALGAILLIMGLFWHLSMASLVSPAKLKVVEENFLSLLRTLWDGEGKVLDIGAGRGRVAVSIAREFTDAQVTGVDTWTGMWSLFRQTKAGAEKNAMIAKVDNRCKFQYGNAMKLPFEDGEFSLVVSAFTFHEIRVPDRTVLLEEAVRVLAPGGTFVICDLFPRGYRVKNVPGLLKKVEQLGAEDVKYKTFQEAGMEVRGLSGIWRFAYLSGKKKPS